MKKLLSILGSISLVSFSSSSVVSCKNNSNKLIDIVFKWKDKEVSGIYFTNDKENKKLTINYNKEVNNLLCIEGMSNEYIKISDINHQKHTITFELKDGKEKFTDEQKFTFMGINSKEKVISISYKDVWKIKLEKNNGDIKIIDNVSKDNKEEKFETTYSKEIIGLKRINLDDYKDLIKVDIDQENKKITCSWIKENFIYKNIPESITLEFDADNAEEKETISLEVVDKRKKINFTIKYQNTNGLVTNPSEIKLPYYNNELWFNNNNNNMEKFQFVTVNIEKQNNFEIDIEHIKNINNKIDSKLIEISPSDNNNHIGFIFIVNIKKKNLTKEDIEELKGKEFVISDKKYDYKPIKLKIEVDDKRYQEDDWLLSKTINFNIVEDYDGKFYPDSKTKAGNGYLIIVHEYLRNLIEDSQNIENASALVKYNNSMLNVSLNNDEKDIKFKDLFSINANFDRYDIKKTDDKIFGTNLGQTKEGSFIEGQKVRALRIELKHKDEIKKIMNEDLRKKALEIREEIIKKKYKIDLKLKIECIKVLHDYSSKEIHFVGGLDWPNK